MDYETMSQQPMTSDIGRIVTAECLVSAHFEIQACSQLIQAAIESRIPYGITKRSEQSSAIHHLVVIHASRKQLNRLFTVLILVDKQQGDNSQTTV